MPFRQPSPRLARSASGREQVDDDTHNTSYCKRTRANSVGRDAAALWRARANVRPRNRFFQKDFDELRAAGYLKIGVPQDLGGLGFSLAEVAAQQRRLAYRAPATALAINMHTHWTGVAADLRRMGDSSLEWLLREAVAGEVFAAGHGETVNDLPLFLSTTKAERADGGYRFSGHKMFGSLSPVWTRLGLHGMDTSDPAAPKIVHAFLPRNTPGYPRVRGVGYVGHAGYTQRRHDS
jgi:alkylation response protein AidB-like acyl-CoA dehydrogenase